MPLKIGIAFPPIDGATTWINNVHNAERLREPTEMPSLVYFWAKSCPTCKANMPRLQSLRDKYAAHGLHLIAVHMPRGTFDLDVEAVKAAVEELGITEPCAIDNEHKIGELFDVKAWPTYYLFDKDAKLKRHAAGGFGVRMIEAALKDLFGE